MRVEGAIAADFSKVMERVRRQRAAIAAHASAERFSKLGVDVYFKDAPFGGPREVEVDGRRLDFARAVIATGARAAKLPIPGIEEAGNLTNETAFTLTALPQGGPPSDDHGRASGGSRVVCLTPESGTESPSAPVAVMEDPACW